MDYNPLPDTPGRLREFGKILFIPGYLTYKVITTPIPFDAPAHDSSEFEMKLFVATIAMFDVLKTAAHASILYDFVK